MLSRRVTRGRCAPRNGLLVPGSLSIEPHSETAPKAPPEIPEELLDSDAVKVVRRLRRAGHQTYLVGGCVRDLLLGIRPKDFDVATSAHPNQVKEIFRNSRLIGRRFRLAHVFFRYEEHTSELQSPHLIVFPLLLL